MTKFKTKFHGSIPKPLWPLLIALVLGWPAARAGQGEEAADKDALLDKVCRTLSAADTVYSTFVQERRVALFNEPLKSEGVLCFRKPRSIRWEITGPYKSILISDGEHVAQWEWMNDHWKKLDIAFAQVMRRAVEQIMLVLQGSFARGNEDYAVEVSAGEDVRVTLTPKRKGLGEIIATIQIHLSPDLKETRRVVLNEPDGDATTIRFTSQQANVAFPGGAFDLTSPLPVDQLQRALSSGPSPAPASPPPAPSR
jgi:outer membrane lipoprotein-sorting protein